MKSALLGLIACVLAAPLVAGNVQHPSAVEAACFSPHLFGDADGNNRIDAGDAFLILQDIARLPLPLIYCVDDDVDCSGQIDSVDALATLRYLAHLAYTQADACPKIGDTVGGPYPPTPTPAPPTY